MTQRIHGIRDDEATGVAREIFATSNELLGRIANLQRILAHSPHLARWFLPLVAAVIVTTSWLVWSGHALTLFHLIGLLLVVAIGSNYSLFFDRAAGEGRERTVTSLLFANVSTIIGFGLLSFSQAPVLNAIGFTVALGAARDQLHERHVPALARPARPGRAPQRQPALHQPGHRGDPRGLPAGAACLMAHFCRAGRSFA